LLKWDKEITFLERIKKNALIFANVKGKTDPIWITKPMENNSIIVQSNRKYSLRNIIRTI
jgi:hypothetical protein